MNKQAHHGSREHHSRDLSGQSSMTGVSQSVDPVCGMTVSVDSSHRTEFAGHEYVFCCRERFQLDPQRYASRAVREDRYVAGRQDRHVDRTHAARGRRDAR